MAAGPRYRYPGERRTLALTLLVAAIVVLALTPLSMGGVLLLLLFGLAVRVAMVSMRVRAIRRTLSPASEHPRVARLVERCARRLDLDPQVEVFVERRPVLNAYAIGLREPYAVVLYTGLVDALDDQELMSVIGHEPFLWWMRATEFTADRAGLIACGGLDGALSTQLKLALGRGWRSVEISEVIRRFREQDVGLLDQLGSLTSTHPELDARMDRLVDFRYSEQYPG